MQTPMHSQAADGFYDLCFLSCISRFSNSWQKLHLHLSATKDEGWCVQKPARLELSELMPALTVSFCRGHLLLLQSVTRPCCALFHSCHAEYFKWLVFLPSQNTLTNWEIISGQSLSRKKPVSILALQLGARRYRSQDCHSSSLFMEEV